MKKHTPTPWKTGRSYVGEPYIHVDAANKDIEVAQCIRGKYGISTETAEANAEFIVRACNQYAALNRVAKAAAAINRNVDEWVELRNALIALEEIGGDIA